MLNVRPADSRQPLEILGHGADRASSPRGWPVPPEKETEAAAMGRAVSDEAIANAKRLFTAHTRRPDGECACGQPYGMNCRNQREYAFNVLRLEGFDMTWDEADI